MMQMQEGFEGSGAEEDYYYEQDMGLEEYYDMEEEMHHADEFGDALDDEFDQESPRGNDEDLEVAAITGKMNE